MGTIRLMRAKLHRVRVTNANVNYVGSIAIDSELLEKAQILPLEEIQIVNISNGNRWTTYVLPAEPGSRRIEPNGGGALLAKKGDILIMYTVEEKSRDEVVRDGHAANVVIADEHNGVHKLLRQSVVPQPHGVGFSGEELTRDAAQGEESPA